MFNTDQGSQFTSQEFTQVLQEAANLLAGQPVPGANPDDVRELLNYRRAFEYVSSYLDHGGPITERLILEIHRRLVEGVRGGTADCNQYHLQANSCIVDWSALTCSPRTDRQVGLANGVRTTILPEDSLCYCCCFRG